MSVSSKVKILYTVFFVMISFIPIYYFDNKNIVIYGIILFPILILVLQFITLISLNNNRYRLISIFLFLFTDRLGLYIIANKIVSSKDKYGTELMFENILDKAHFSQNVILVILFLIFLKKVIKELLSYSEPKSNKKSVNVGVLAKS